MSGYTNKEKIFLQKYENMRDKDGKPSFSEWSQKYEIVASLRARLPQKYIDFMTTLDNNGASVYTGGMMGEMRFYFEKGYTIEQVKKKLNLK